MHLLRKNRDSEAPAASDSWGCPDLAEDPGIQPAADARPCDVCSFAGFWLDYEGQRRCARCHFPPTLAIVKSFVGAVELSDGVYGWCDLSEAMAPIFAAFYSEQRKQRAIEQLNAEVAASLDDF